VRDRNKNGNERYREHFDALERDLKISVQQSDLRLSLMWDKQIQIILNVLSLTEKMVTLWNYLIQYTFDL
jgi:hypothetical protein